MTTHAWAASPADRQLALAAAGAVKIQIRGTGWVRVGQPALLAAGLSANVDPASLQLFADGVEQALALTGNGDGSFTADEAIEFYGMGRDTASTDLRTYWLLAGSTAARVAVQAAPAAETPGPASFPHTETVAGRQIYLAAVRNGDRSNFFGAAVSTTPVTVNLTAPHPDPSALSAAVLTVALQGVTATAHAVDVGLNGLKLGTCTLNGTDDAACSFAATGLAAGANSVTLAAHASSDYTATESVSISYAHLYAADGDTLAFTALGGSRVDVGGFSQGDIRMVDVTDPTHPIELVTSIGAGADSFHATADLPVGQSPRLLYAFTGAHVMAPVAVQADAPSSWSSPHDGELLILSHGSFLEALGPLVARRQAQGWQVQLVDLADVYDERGFGDKSPEAIRDFIQAARAGWRVPPRYVLLVGDATFDPRNFLGLGDFDFAPTRLIDTASMETASDDWFVDSDEDGVPELAIGRWPVRTADQASAVVAKTLGYAGIGDIGRGGLFVSDLDDVGLDFTGASLQAAAQVSGRMPVAQFSRTDPAATEAALLDKLNAGPFLVNYLGHGSVQVWDGLLNDADAAGLTNNAHPSIYVVMNCLNGFFQDLYTTSLAETLLQAPGGAVAVWASSTLADFDPQPTFDQEFLMGIGPKSLGEATVAAKSAITDLDSRRTWLLFGDPTLLGSPAASGTPDGGTADAAPPRDAGGFDGGTTAPDSGTNDASGRDAVAPEGGSGGAAGGFDAAADAGQRPMGGGGCDCAVGHGTGASGGAAGLMLLGLLAARTRRRGGGPRARRPGKRRALAGLLLALAMAAGGQAHAAYAYRMNININKARIGVTGTSTTTLSNYPLLIDITSNNLKSSPTGHVLTGTDIVFLGEDSTTCGGAAPCTLKYEIDNYDSTTGHLIAWVNIPVLNTNAATSSQTIVIEYGDATVLTSQQNVNGTWNTNFKAVWHMTQAGASMTDSTSTAANATVTSTPSTAAVTGQINTAFSTTSTTGTAYLDYTKTTTFNWASGNDFTYEGWFKTTDQYGPLLSQRGSTTNGAPVIDVMVGFDGGSTGAGSLRALLRDDTNGTYAEVTSGGTTVNDGSWHHFTLTRSSGTVQGYLDGSSLGTSSAAGSSGALTCYTAGAGYNLIGKEGNWVASSYTSAENEYLAASFDEYRISNTARSSDWVATDYNTMKTPSSTYALDTEVGTTCGGGTVGAGETCDDGNVLSGDGCSSLCQTETGYTCMGTPSSCTTTCNDSITAGSETCDDGNLTNGDGCSSTCQVESGYHCTTGASKSVCTKGSTSLFTYYKTITVDRTKVGTSSTTTLSNYPMLFSVTDAALADTSHSGHVNSSSGYDIIFRGTSSTVCGGALTACTLAHEIEKYDNTTGQLIAWVNIPTLNGQAATSNTSFQIMYGNPYINTTSERVTSTWSSSFTGVWHLNKDPSTTAPADSSSSGNTGTNNGATTATGQIGSGVSTNGSTTYVAFNSGTSLNVASGADFTYSVWVKTTGTSGGIFSMRNSSSGNPVLDVMVGYDGASTSAGALMALARDDSSAGQNDVVEGSTSISNGSWHLVTVTRSGTTLQVYDNTTSAGTKVVTSGALTTDTRNLGREGYWATNGNNPGQQYLAATFDELRVATTARALDWITTDYNNQSSPSTFIAYTTGTGASETTPLTIHTDVELVSLQATDNCPGTVISWQTASEIDVLGFNVYRQQGGQRVRLNTDLLPATGIGGGAGNFYQLVDAASADPSRTYWVEEVLFGLDTHLHGPIAPTPGPACSKNVTATGPTVSPSGSPSPVVDPAPAAGESDQAGGCSIGGPSDTRGAIIAFLVLALISIRRRARGEAHKVWLRRRGS